MKLIVIVLSLLVVANAYAEVKLFRYVDKLTGDEMGICYSDKDGNPQVNKDWQAIEITENDKEAVIALQKAQIAAKPVVKSDIEVRLEAAEEKIKVMEKLPIEI